SLSRGTRAPPRPAREPKAGRRSCRPPDEVEYLVLHLRREPPHERHPTRAPSAPSLVSAETPRAHERPGDVLGRVGHVRELPVEDGDKALLVHDEVADAEVAVPDDALPLERDQLAGPLH